VEYTIKSGLRVQKRALPVFEHAIEEEIFCGRKRIS
jgi:hypothetical protein